MDPDATHISESIEHGVEGLLRFTARYLRTFWLMLRRPHKCARLLNDSDHPPYYTRPYTFLAIGGFFFTLVLSAYPRGFTELLDSIWYYDEIMIEIRDHWTEAFTVTGLLLAGIPVLLTSALLGSLYGTLALPSEHRKSFGRIVAFSFGYQALTIFSFFYLGLILTAIEKIIPYEESLSRLTSSSDILSSIIAYSLMFGLPFTAFLNPIMAIYSFVQECLPNEKTWKKGIHLIGVVIFVATTFIAMSYTASLPGAAREALADPPPTVKISLIGDPQVIAELQTDGSTSIGIDCAFVIDNARDESLTVPLTKLRMLLRKEVENGQNVDLETTTVSLKDSQLAIPVIMLPRYSLDYFSAHFETELEPEQVQSLRSSWDSANNHYSWDLVIHIGNEPHTYEISRHIDENYVTWTDR